MNLDNFTANRISWHTSKLVWNHWPKEHLLSVRPSTSNKDLDSALFFPLGPFLASPHIPALVACGDQGAVQQMLDTAVSIGTKCVKAAGYVVQCDTYSSSSTECQPCSSTPTNSCSCSFILPHHCSIRWNLIGQQHNPNIGGEKNMKHRKKKP